MSRMPAKHSYVPAIPDLPAPTPRRFVVKLMVTIELYTVSEVTETHFCAHITPTPPAPVPLVHCHAIGGCCCSMCCVQEGLQIFLELPLFSKRSWSCNGTHICTPKIASANMLSTPTPWCFIAPFMTTVRVSSINSPYYRVAHSDFLALFHYGKVAAAGLCTGFWAPALCLCAPTALNTIVGC